MAESSLTALIVTALITAVVHTIAGPDHYLPFIAIAKSRRYSMAKTMLWTLFCGIGHIGSALLLALLFLSFSELISASKLEWLEANRGNLAAYALVGMGVAIILHSAFLHWRGKPHLHTHIQVDGTVLRHKHSIACDHARDGERGVSYWVLFIIFVLGPCEALLPLLTASSVLGTGSVLIVSLLFSAATIATMMFAVALGLRGLNLIHSKWLERFAPEVSGVTLLFCGIAILFGL